MPLTGRAGLWAAGPKIQLALSLLEPQLQTLADRGETPPAPVAGWGIIDTGACVTCVDENAARNAGLATVDTGPIASATHDNHTVPIFAGQLDVAGIPQNINTYRAYGVNLEAQGLIALIGRDVLANCILVYNGLDGSFSLAL